jgi:SAM-dependent methyltransferase
VATFCGICSGELVLLHAGTGGVPTAADMSPTCHTPGVHGDLFRCTRCGTVQQPVLPSGRELVDLYRGMRDDAYLDEEAGRRATARRLLDRLEDGTGGRGSLLEVGCGHGLLLDEARARGWDVVGLEPAAAGRAHARDVLGLDVRDGTLADLDPVRDGGFDALVMVDVIEHLDDPVGALRAARGLLAPGGVLVVVTPDPSSLAARLTRDRWWGYLPAHAHLIPRRTLRRLLADEGFAALDETTLWRTFTLGYWMGGLAERGALGGVLDRLRRLRIARRPVTLSLGDERVLLARHGVPANARAHGAAAAPPVAQPAH